MAVHGAVRSFIQSDRDADEVSAVVEAINEALSVYQVRRHYQGFPLLIVLRCHYNWQYIGRMVI